MQFRPGEQTLAESSWISMRRGWITYNNTHTLLITNQRILLLPNIICKVLTLGRAQPIEIPFDRITGIELRNRIFWNKSISVSWRERGKERKLRVDYLKASNDAIAAALQQMVPKEKWSSAPAA
jgi:hypothetical protein